MNPILLGLLVVVGGGKLPSGKTYVLYAPDVGVTRAQLVTAGIGTDCNRKDVRVQTVNDPQCGKTYCRERIDAAVCTPPAGVAVDFGVIVKRRIVPYLVLDPNWVGDPATSTLAVDAEAAEPDTCACAPRGGSCLFTDGGTPPQNNTYPAATMTGTCSLKPCVELAGVNSMPAECL